MSPVQAPLCSRCFRDLFHTRWGMFHQEPGTCSNPATVATAEQAVEHRERMDKMLAGLLIPKPKSGSSPTFSKAGGE